MMWGTSNVNVSKKGIQDHNTRPRLQGSDSEREFAVPGQLPEIGKWLIDSSHMTPQKEFLINYREFDTPEKVGLGDGRIVEAVGVGNVCLHMLFKVSTSKQAVMYDVLYVPKLACNLFSVRATAHERNIISSVLDSKSNWEAGFSCQQVVSVRL